MFRHWLSPSRIEGIGLVFALVLSLYFLALRIRGGALPTGDEGSWLSVAAELARGNGFTTRWLEAHFLLPYTLPRPDDFRYPALTSLLALSFQVFGLSIETARWTVGGVFLLFTSATYAVCRHTFGKWAAMAGLFLMVTSLLQLEWNAAVYTEGLFGLVVTGLVAWCLFGERSTQNKQRLGYQSVYWWIILGFGLGCLYLVRVNGVLFLPGVAWLYWSRRKFGLSWKHPMVAFAAFVILVSPWLIRTGMSFGSPFHIAGSAGLLREPGGTHTLTLIQYLSNHDFLFPLKRMIIGFISFFKVLHHYEHGLEIIPLLLVGIGVIRRSSFVNPFILVGFLLSYTASVYASYQNWAGVRYMAGMLPLIYAYGLSQIPKAWSSKKVVFTLGIALLLLPVINPHRFYVRKYSLRNFPSGAYPYRPPLMEHLSKLESQLPPLGRYYAASLCGVNFLLPDRDCVGLQELYDPTWFSRSMKSFHPSLLILTHSETRDRAMLKALDRMHSEGFTADTLQVGELAVYYSLKLKP